MLPLFLDQWLRHVVFHLFRAFVVPKAGLAGCPGCGKALPKIKISPTHLWDTRIDCPHCGRWMSVLELEPPGITNAVLLAESLAPDGEPLPMPVGSRIEVVERAGTRRWRLPAKGGFNFFTVFGLFWLASSSMFLILTLFGETTGGPKGLAFEGSIAGVFVLIGLVILFLGIKLSHTEHWLLLNDESFTHESRFLRRAKRRTFERDDLTDISLVVAYEENYQPVHTIQITGRCDKCRFGVALSVEEKAWLLSDLRRALRWTAPTAAATVDNVTRPTEAFQAGELQVAPFRDKCEIVIPSIKSAFPLLIGGGFFLVILGFMILNGPSWDDSSDSPIGNAFDFGFALLWYGPLSIGFMCGVLALWTGLRLLSMRRKITVSPDGLRLQWQRGTQHGEWHWNSAQIDGIEIRSVGRSGSSNATFRLAVALPDFIGGFGHARTHGELTPVLNALYSAMGRAHPPTPITDPH